MAVEPPYTEKDCKECNRIMYDLNKDLELYDKLDAAGIDTSEARMRHQDLWNQLTKFKQVFFPGR